MQSSPSEENRSGEGLGVNVTSDEQRDNWESENLDLKSADLTVSR